MNSKTLFKYATIIGVLGVVGYVGSRVRSNFDTSEKDEYEMIKKYLLNDSPLYGYNKPKLWIHTKYEINARKWLSFYSKNTTDLNQEYIHICIQSIIQNCSDDFHICLISDESFSKLLPSWDIQLCNVAEPFRTQYRELAMAQILYYYGGFVVPNSFLCLNNLISLYQTGIANNKPFVLESINRISNEEQMPRKLAFVPDKYFMGCLKNDPHMEPYISYLKSRCQNPHFSEEITFKGATSQFLIQQMNTNKMNMLDGKYVGIKTKKNKPVLIEELFEDNIIEFSSDMCGIYIDQDVILNRHKYEWFAQLSKQQVFEVNNVLVKYMKQAVMERPRKTTIKAIEEGEPIHLNAHQTVVAL